MARHRLLPAGEAGRGMAHFRADRGGGASPILHGAQRRKDGDTAAITKRGRTAAPTARPLRQGAGTGPGNSTRRGGLPASAALIIPPMAARNGEGRSARGLIHRRRATAAGAVAPLLRHEEEAIAPLPYRHNAKAACPLISV